ncbi:MAG: hypothetical protein FWD49_06530 [Firmicutes bacterium]|nr:hypothetical protein [Bacillota bacterium]
MGYLKFLSGCYLATAFAFNRIKPQRGAICITVGATHGTKAKSHTQQNPAPSATGRRGGVYNILPLSPCPALRLPLARGYAHYAPLGLSWIYP